MLAGGPGLPTAAFSQVKRLLVKWLAKRLRWRRPWFTKNCGKTLTQAHLLDIFLENRPLALTQVPVLDISPEEVAFALTQAVASRGMDIPKRIACMQKGSSAIAGPEVCRVVGAFRAGTRRPAKWPARPTRISSSTRQPAVSVVRSYFFSTRPRSVAAARRSFQICWWSISRAMHSVSQVPHWVQFHRPFCTASTTRSP